MTIMTRPSFVFKKTEHICSPPMPPPPLYEEKQMIDEESLDVSVNIGDGRYPPVVRSPGHATMIVMGVTMLMVVVSFVSGSMMYYSLFNVQHPIQRRYQYHGFCAIPMDTSDFQNQQQMMEPNYRVMSLQWSPQPELQLMAANALEEQIELLQEQLQIENDVENISVTTNGRTVNFVHDFSANTTGIIEPDRCFLLDLEPELVLSPREFLAGISSGAAFDVSHVRSLRRALLPALPRDLRPDLLACPGRPVYRLQPVYGLGIRKRSADDNPKYHYIQFSGKHIEEIEISNLADILDSEKKNK